MRESVIEKAVCHAARRSGWLAHPKAGPGNRGWPDRTFTKAGEPGGDARIMFVEFKAPGARPSPLQRHVHRDLRAKGYEVHVIDSIAGGRALFA